MKWSGGGEERIQKGRDGESERESERERDFPVIYSTGKCSRGLGNTVPGLRERNVVIGVCICVFRACVKAVSPCVLMAGEYNKKPYKPLLLFHHFHFLLITDELGIIIS